MKPKKLIRDKVIFKLKTGEYEQIYDPEEINKLYALKVQEELAEIQRSNHQDVTEFADLIDVAIAFAQQNGHSLDTLHAVSDAKAEEKGEYTNWALTNMNPNNPSNKLYLNYPAPFLKYIKVPVNSEDFFINDVGCLGYTLVGGTFRHSSFIEPTIIGEFLDNTIHELVGYAIMGIDRLVLYKNK